MALGADRRQEDGGSVYTFLLSVFFNFFHWILTSTLLNPSPYFIHSTQSDKYAIICYVLSSFLSIQYLPDNLPLAPIPKVLNHH